MYKSNYINKDISHLDRLPQTVTNDKPSFYAFIQNINTYICNSTSQIYGILSQIQCIIGVNYSDDISISYLERLCRKMDVQNKYWTSVANIDDSKKRKILFTALQGAVAKRLANSTKANMQQLLYSLYPGKEQAEITDNGNMSFTAVVKNAVTNVNESFLIKYIAPQITGVQSNISFNLAGTMMAQTVKSTGTNVYVEEIPTDTKSGYYWMDITTTDGVYQEEEIVYNVSQSTTDIPEGATGYWILEII